MCSIIQDLVLLANIKQGLGQTLLLIISLHCAVFTLAKFRAIMPATATQDSHHCTCLGPLGRRDTDRIISICIVSPRVAKISKEGDLTMRDCNTFSRINFSNVNELLST